MSSRRKTTKVKLDRSQDGYSCPICHLKFKRDLKRHMESHKPASHQCPYCDHKTRQRSNLKSHISAKHKRDFPHKCPFTVVEAALGRRVPCDAAFNHPGDLTKHKQSHHPSEVPPRKPRKTPVRPPISQSDADKQEKPIKQEETDGCLEILMHGLIPSVSSSGADMQSAGVVTAGVVTAGVTRHVPSTRTSRFHPYQYGPVHVTYIQYAWMASTGDAMFGSLDPFQRGPAPETTPNGNPTGS